MRFPDRYNRQQLLPQIGRAGQTALAGKRVLILGCGALGSTLADQLARAGVGFLRLVDRDIVESTNLQRQTLYDERDVSDMTPKAHAAARRLSGVNSDITLEPIATDVHSGNIEALARDVDLILDGSDNVSLRYLVNDVAIKLARPWVYGGCVGVEGRVMPILPGRGACLRCVFPTPPTPGELPTCDTAGVLGPAVTIVASIQSIFAMKILLQHDLEPTLSTLDLWAGRWKHLDLRDARKADCPACSQRRFEFLDRIDSTGVSLCGRNAIQIRPTGATQIDLGVFESRLNTLGKVTRTAFLLKLELADGKSLTIFPDARAIVAGTSDPTIARSLYSRYVGM